VSSSTEVKGRLVKVFGAERGGKVFEEVLGKLGLAELADPDDEMRFADELIGGGGLMEAIGRSLRVRALLRGAKG
tara:strand:- start:2642 stop:2866 length:225 start_codon:yes stop_codon:yes gene_type:complete